MSHTVLKLMEINLSVLGIARWGRSHLAGWLCCPTGNVGCILHYEKLPH